METPKSWKLEVSFSASGNKAEWTGGTLDELLSHAFTHLSAIAWTMEPGDTADIKVSAITPTGEGEQVTRMSQTLG